MRKRAAPPAKLSAGPPCFSETASRGCAGEVKRLSLPVSSAAGWHSIPKDAARSGKNPVYRVRGKGCRRPRIQCLVRGLPAACPSGAYASPRLCRGAWLTAGGRALSARRAHGACARPTKARRPEGRPAPVKAAPRPRCPKCRPPLRAAPAAARRAAAVRRK